jgi:hypothetical protein
MAEFLACRTQADPIDPHLGQRLDQAREKVRLASVMSMKIYDQAKILLQVWMEGASLEELDPRVESGGNGAGTSAHECFVLVSNPVAFAGNAPDEFKRAFLGENRMIIQKGNGYHFAFPDFFYEGQMLWRLVNLHGTVPFDKKLDFLLVGVIMGGGQER